MVAAAVDTEQVLKRLVEMVAAEVEEAGQVMAGLPEQEYNHRNRAIARDMGTTDLSMAVVVGLVVEEVQLRYWEIIMPVEVNLGTEIVLVALQARVEMVVVIPDTEKMDKRALLLFVH